MEREAQLLQLLDAVVGGVFALGDSEGNGGGDRVRGEALRTLECAGELAMERTHMAASDLLAVLEDPDHSAETGWLARLESAAENLQVTAEAELEERFRASIPETSEPGMPWGDFVLEGREHLANIERDLLALEGNPDDTESIHSLFRSFHTIKGLTAIAGIETGREVAHQTENLLDQVRAGERRLNERLINLSLASADFLSEVVAAAEKLDRGEQTAMPSEADALLDRLFAAIANQAEPAAGAVQSVKSTAAAIPSKSEQTGSAVKVDTAKLDQLVDLVGELVIAQSLVQLDPAIQGIAEPKTAKNLSQLGRITSDLQKTAMSLRVVPIGLTFRRMTRVFRDLVRESEKDAILETAGEDAELDRTIVEKLADPLMHMIRNSVDHGLESPAAREAAGKPRQGRIRLAATHQSGHVVIEVSDDGRGLDKEKILRKAVERGLVKDPSTLAHNEVLELIFEPGFSTSEKVTEISGRGVGMDVVKKEIERLRGRVEVRSEPGKGTTFLLRVPLTLAIINALVVKQAGDRFILPLFTVRELLPPGGQKINTVEGRNEICLIRESVVPVVRLDRVLALPLGAGKPTESSAIVVVESGARRLALAVDEVVGKQEVVIKSLGDWLGRIAGVAGGAILGDGGVGIILDVDSLFVRETHGLAA